MTLSRNKWSSPPEAWQLRTLLRLIEEMGSETLGWLTSEDTSEGKPTIEFWLTSHGRVKDLLDALEETSDDD